MPTERCWFKELRVGDVLWCPYERDVGWHIVIKVIHDEKRDWNDVSCYPKWTIGAHVDDTWQFLRLVSLNTPGHQE